MNTLKKITAGLRSMFRREKLDADMAEEMRQHLERRTQSLIVEGLPPDEARYSAQRSFGGVDQLKEIAREQRGTLWLEHFSRDVRFALRQLVRSPGFAAVSILSLGLGIGACTAVFTLVNSVLLRSLPVPNPQELRILSWTGTDAWLRSFNGTLDKVGNRTAGDLVSEAMLSKLREKGIGLADIFGFAPVDNVAVFTRGEAFSGGGMLVSDNFFTGLGARPFIGALFAPGQANVNTETSRQVVITHGWWQRRFGGNPQILGQALTLNGTSFTISGVLARDFPGVRPGDPRDFYVLLTTQSPLFERPVTTDPKDHWWVRLMARLHPTGSEAQLKAMLDVAFAHEAASLMKTPEILVRHGAGGLATDREHYRKPLLLMMGAVALVMLVACANLAGLSLARGAARQHELAVRAAIGAGRWRLLRQSMTESLLLAVVGGGLGVAIAVWGKTVISRLLAGTAEGVPHDLSLNLFVLGFALAAAVLTAVLSGLLPALQASRVDPLDGLKARGALSAPKLRLGKVLVAAQIALSVVLLTGGGLYLRTLLNLRSVDTGFNTDNLLLFHINPPVAGKSPMQISGFYDQVQQALLSTPGVQNASPVMLPLLSGQQWSGGFAVAGRSSEASGTLEAHRLIVGESYFATMGIPLHQGRVFTATDSETAPKVIVVNETFVKKYFPGEPPLGSILRIFRQDWQIVGVCRDTKYGSIREPAPPTVYFSFRQNSLRYGASFTVRTSLYPLALTDAVRRLVAAIDPSVTVSKLATQEQVRDRALSPERLVATLGGVLAGLALLLACVGLYGLMSFNVTRRKNEIAIRMAIGAHPRDVAWAVVREALWLAAIGIGVGLPVMVGVTSLIKSQLYGVPPQDPVTLVAVTVMLVAVTLLAAWLPARRATRVDPLVALRAE